MYGKSVRQVLVLTVCYFTSLLVHAELTIDITQGMDEPTPIAIVPFAWDSSSALAEDVALIVTQDLQKTGQFYPIPIEDMLSLPQKEVDVYYRDWRILGVEFLLIGRMQRGDDGKYYAEYDLFDVFRQEVVLQNITSGKKNQLRDIAHAISDAVYEELTGIRGVFSTKIAYVSMDQKSNGERLYRLNVTDMDGARTRTILKSEESILSLSWSPDNKWLAYVSFNDGYSAIYIHNLKTNKREQLTGYKGLNSAPSWSPDGDYIAMTLSMTGNPEVYIMNMDNRRLQQITFHYGIDTEPDWHPDGQSLIFTSNRGGKPQIYQVMLATGEAKRLTFVGDYNARGRLSPDGQNLITVNRSNGTFHIALRHMYRDYFNILTQRPLVESPSVAPNGGMLVYATQQRGLGVIMIVSIDGRVEFPLPSDFGELREPAWSSYIN